jgi:hypothetical protein
MSDQANLLIPVVAEHIPEGSLGCLREASFVLDGDGVHATCDICIPHTALEISINGVRYVVSLRDPLEAAIGLHLDTAAQPDPPPAIPEDAWRTVYGGNLSLGVWRPEHAPNVIDVRGDVSISTDGVHCRWGLQVKCGGEYEIRLRGPAQNVEAGRAAANAAYPTLVAWAAQLAVSDTDDRQLTTGD